MINKIKSNKKSKFLEPAKKLLFALRISFYRLNDKKLFLICELAKIIIKLLHDIVVQANTVVYVCRFSEKIIRRRIEHIGDFNELFESRA